MKEKQMRIEKGELFRILSNTINGANFDDLNEAVYKIYDVAGYHKQEWISVEEAPKTYRDEYGELIPFLVCCKGNVYPFRAVYDGKCWGDGIGKLNVTHWMPLPDAPKGEKDD